MVPMPAEPGIDASRPLVFVSTVVLLGDNPVCSVAIDPGAVDEVSAAVEFVKVTLVALVMVSVEGAT